MRTLLRGVSQIAVLIALSWVPFGALLAFWVPLSAYSATPGTDPSAQAVKSLSLQVLEQGIADRLKRVEEFRFIEQEAAKLGVRAWLFGGTAAGYAHYVKWDMQREKGDTRFQKDRFDYDYTNIYRSTQDLDIVIDGDAEQAQKLQNALQEKYPHLQGSKTAWEVRLLTQDMGDKLAILNNPNFLNQHTDSNSTGLIEITKPKEGESVVRDARDWNSKAPFFLKDVQEGRLHYYFSPSHGSTQFAKEGRNPPILSVIRYLTKAFQYELELRPEDIESIKKVIQDFNPKKDTQNRYVANWIEKNGKKLIQNAVNIEYAWDTLEKLGLRTKLIEIQKNVGDIDSLAWWMSKEPLRTQALGIGRGKTARELGLDVVAHETGNFLAYESITRAYTGDSNVLISRNGVQGEFAAYGDGFYTAKGREGARGTGLTIRFHLDPQAREGSDFIVEKSHNYIIVKNKAALKVIPESLALGPIEYFKALADDSLAVNSSDRGILEKFKRRIGSKTQALSDEQVHEIYQIVRAKVEGAPAHQITSSSILKEWSALPASSKFPEIVDILRKSGVRETWIIKNILKLPSWKNQTLWAERWGKLLAEGYIHDQDIASYLLSLPAISEHPDWVQGALKFPELHSVVARQVLSQPFSGKHPEWLKTVLDQGHADIELAKDVLSKPHWKDRPEFVIELTSKGFKGRPVRWEILNHVIPQPHWTSQPRFIEILFQDHGEDPEYNLRTAYITKAVSQPHWKDHPWLIDKVMKETNNPEIDRTIARLSYLKDHPDWAEVLVKRGLADRELAIHFFSQPESKNHPEWAEMALKRGYADSEFAVYVLSKPHWKDHPEWVEYLVRRGNSDQELAESVLTQPFWKESLGTKQLEWAETLLSRQDRRFTNMRHLLKSVFKEPAWYDRPERLRAIARRYSSTMPEILEEPNEMTLRHPEIVKGMIEGIADQVDGKEKDNSIKRWLDSINKDVLALPEWKDHPELRRLTGGLPPTYASLKKGIQREEKGKAPAFSIRGCIYNFLSKRLPAEQSH
jgi:hypothetical protein